MGTTTHLSSYLVVLRRTRVFACLVLQPRLTSQSVAAVAAQEHRLNRPAERVFQLQDQDRSDQAPIDLRSTASHRHAMLPCPNQLVVACPHLGYPATHLLSMGHSAL